MQKEATTTFRVEPEARPTKPPLDPEERKIREAAVKYAQASVELEGFQLNDAAKKRAQNFIDGQIDLDNFVNGQ